jgi:hypothetical protein
MHTISFKKLKSIFLWSVFLSALYGLSVLSYVWWHCVNSNLPGGKYGPLDAYRHTLASAVVAYSSSPKLVIIITKIMEGKGRPIDKMDQHNNAIGAAIGEQADSLSSLEQCVKNQILKGTTNTQNIMQSTWLSKVFWRENIFW